MCDNGAPLVYICKRHLTVLRFASGVWLGELAECAQKCHWTVCSSCTRPIFRPSVLNFTCFNCRLVFCDECEDAHFESSASERCRPIILDRPSSATPPESLPATQPVEGDEEEETREDEEDAPRFDEEQEGDPDRRDPPALDGASQNNQEKLIRERVIGP